jgi:salicylate hydroxylase
MKNVSKWAIQTVRPLDAYSSERVILLGDAVRFPLPSMQKEGGANTSILQAHAMTPYLGSGAGQGIEVSIV